MYLKRKIDQDIEKWAHDKNKMPLVVLGARQVGKTTTVKNIAHKTFKNLYYINFMELKNDPHFLKFKSNPAWKNLIDFIQLSYCWKNFGSCGANWNHHHAYIKFRRILNES